MPGDITPLLVVKDVAVECLGENQREDSVPSVVRIISPLP